MGNGEKPEPRPEFMAMVRAQVFTWLGHYLDQGLELDEEGWTKLLALYEDSFDKGLRKRAEDGELWWEVEEGKSYSRKAVRAIAREINALPTTRPTTEDLQSCFEKAEATLNGALERLKKDELLRLPILCDPT